MKRAGAIAAVALLVALAGRLCADELPPRQQALLAARVLAYDRNLKKRAGERKAAIVVLFQEGNQNSESLSLDITSALEEAAGSASVSGLTIQVAAVAYNGAAELDAKLAALHPAAIYVCPGLADAIPAITAAARRRSVLTLTSTLAYVKAGLSIGLLRAEERPVIVINLAPSRAEGADLDAALLRLATVIK